MRTKQLRSKNGAVLELAKKLTLLFLLLTGLVVTGLPRGAAQKSRGAARPTRIPPKSVVLTFDDAVKSHVTIVAPLLKQLGFRATFFITHAWMNDQTDFLSWEEVARIHRLGFEIGNHSWTHGNFSKPESAAKLGEELQMVEKELAKVGVPKPVSFAWCGNAFGPDAIEQLRRNGYKIARRGMQPEIPYGQMQVGPSLNVQKHHPLLIPTTGDAYPDWTFEHFKKVLASTSLNEVIVLQFHGVPDVKHPWVNTPPEAFRVYMQYLKDNGYQTFAMRDLLAYYDEQKLPDDPLLKTQWSNPAPGKK
ncbi:MAG: polysaccharide deacetylase family protein [Acidobacteria bacterium]|nr:polysaccharide deacetylase family protein [Acidobacteriota bacterium]